MKTQFKVGDRVAAYLSGPQTSRRVGKVKEICPAYLILDLGHSSNPYAVPPQACRKLVKKERRRIWIGEQWHDILTSPPTDPSLWTEFVEVRNSNRPTSTSQAK